MLKRLLEINLSLKTPDVSAITMNITQGNDV